MRRATILLFGTLLLASPARAAIAGGLTSASRGPLWYATSIDLPPGSGYRIDFTWRMAGSWSASGCYMFQIEPDGTSRAYGGYSSASEADTGAHVVVSPEGSPLSALVAGEPVGRSHGTKTFGCRLDWYAYSVRSTLNFLGVIAGDGPIAGAKITTTLRGGARFLAESSGNTAWVRTERTMTPELWAEGGLSAGMFTGCHSQVVRARTATSFKRQAVVLFDSGEPGANAAPVWAGRESTEIPALLSVHGPVKASGEYVDDTSYGIGGLNFAGPPGDYLFRAEALAAPFCRAQGIPAGKFPRVILAAADADFPACSTRGARIVARARDGHPICR